MTESKQPEIPSSFRSFKRVGETLEITMEENGQLVTYRVHSSCAEQFFQRKGLLPSLLQTETRSGVTEPAE